MSYTTCTKCHGTGLIERFGNIDGGICYDCNGTGKVTKKVAASKGTFINTNQVMTRITKDNNRIVAEGDRIIECKRGSSPETVVSAVFNRSGDGVIKTAEGSEYNIVGGYQTNLYYWNKD